MAASVNPTNYPAGTSHSMETTSGLRPSIKVETVPTSPSPPPSSESNPSKQQPDMTNTYPVDIPPPPFGGSINELRSISTALSAFLSRYDELQDHINFIKTSIDAKLPEHLLSHMNPNQSTPIPSPETCSPHTITPVSDQSPSETATNCERIPEISRKSERPDFSKMPEKTDISKKPEETDTSKIPEETDILKNPALSELENLCERMCGRDIRWYVIAHMSDMDKLRQEVPKALKFAKDPAKLVLKSIGRFFVQGSRAFFRGSPQYEARLAAILILECFLMMDSDGIEIAKEEQEYAAKAAVDWRKRIMHEGGLAKACEADARGLLLLISGFGIPYHVFKNEDIRDLIIAGHAKGIATALRRSIILVPKIPEVIDWMVKNYLEIQAVDYAYTFGLEDKCPPQTILATFLHNKMKDIQHGPAPQMRKAIKKQISDLKYLRKCLEAHKVDPIKLLPDYNINEKIEQLQKQRGLYPQAAKEPPTQKRKANEPEPKRMQTRQHDPKRTRLTSHDNLSQDQTPVRHYNGLTQTTSGYASAYSGSSLSFRSGLPETLTSPLAIGGAGGSYGAGVYRGSQPYDWDTDSALIEKYLGRTYANRVQTYEPQPSTTGLIGLYARPGPSGPPGPLGSSLESFPGLPNSGPSVGGSHRVGPASDLYGFADTIVETERYHGSRASGSGTMRSSYLY